MPAVHCATTRSGTDTINIGAPINGMRRLRSRISGSAIRNSGRSGPVEHETGFAIGNDVFVGNATSFAPEYDQPAFFSLDPALQADRLADAQRLAIANLAASRVCLATLFVKNVGS